MRLDFTIRVSEHQTAQAQAESLLAAERQHSQKILQEQTEKWEATLQQAIQGGEEAVEAERTLTVQAEVETNIFPLELQEAQEELRTWDDWYESDTLHEAETSELQQEEQPILPENPTLPAGPSPLTPPVM